MRIRFLWQAMVIGTLLSAAGCHVQVDKGKNGDDKNVKIDTPLGGLHVRSDQTAAGDLGLPVYPGAQISPDKEGDKSADVHMGFGQWQLHVKVVTYQSPDAQDKVLAFYKDAMGRFGVVLQCDGNHPVGTATITAQGLTCKEDSHSRVKINGNGTSIFWRSRRPVRGRSFPWLSCSCRKAWTATNRKAINLQTVLAQGRSGVRLRAESRIALAARVR